MTDGPPIIAYAGAPDRAAAAAVDAPDENRVFTFAAPPVGSQVIFSVAVFVACAVGALIVVALCLDACLERRRHYGYTLFWSGCGRA